MENIKYACEYFDNRGELDESVIEKLEKEGRLEGQEAIAFLAQCFAGSTKGGESGYSLCKSSAIEHFAHVVVHNVQKH